MSPVAGIHQSSEVIILPCDILSHNLKREETEMRTKPHIEPACPSGGLQQLGDACPTAGQLLRPEKATQDPVGWMKK